MANTEHACAAKGRLDPTAQEIRKLIISMIGKRGSGHTGSSLSCVDILTALYFHVMKVNPDCPQDPDRDRFVLSKGHAAPALYATLARRGYFPAQVLEQLRSEGGKLQGHPDMKKTLGVDMTSGSLGQGLSAGAGMAFGLREKGSPARVFVLMGDGELGEGQVWEAAAVAAHLRLGRLTAIVDLNGLQVHGPTAEVLDHRDLAAKWRAFGWETCELDGHDVPALTAALSRPVDATTPALILARTIKGRGVSFMEGKLEWHGQAPNAEQMSQALAEVDAH